MNAPMDNKFPLPSPRFHLLNNKTLSLQKNWAPKVGVTH